MSKQFKGSLLILASAFFFGTYGVWSKMMAGQFDDYFQGWTRSLIIVITLLIFGGVFKSFRKIDKEDIKYYIIYAVPGAMVVPYYYYGFTHLSIGTATLLFYASLTITSYILGILFFHERMNISKMASLGLGLSGLFSIYSLSLKEALVPIIICSLAGIIGGVEVVFTKKISDKYSAIQLTTCLYSMSFFICFIIYMVMHNFQFNISWDKIAWAGNIGHTISSLMAFLLVVRGYRFLEPSVGGIIGLLEIPIGICFGIFLFGEAITPSIIIGGSLIICSAALPNVYQHFNKDS